MDDNEQAIALAMVAQQTIKQNQLMAQQMLVIMSELASRVEALAMMSAAPRNIEFVFDEKGRPVASTQTPIS